MGLIARYPFTKDLNDYGLSGANLLDDITLQSGGKFGNYLKLTKQRTQYVTISELTNKRKVSISLWTMDLNETVTMWTDYIAFGLNFNNGETNSSANNDLRLEISQSGTTRYTRWFSGRLNPNYPTKTDATRPNLSTTDSYSTNGKWHHIVLCVDLDNGKWWDYFDNKKLSNGSTINTYANFTGVISFGDATGITCGISDVRIYDHILSDTEVHELNKGLALHYTFDDPYCEATTNLKNTVVIADTTSTDYTLLEKGSDDIGSYYIKAYESITWAGVGLPQTAVTAGLPYTWSIDIMPDKNCWASFDGNTIASNYDGNDKAHSSTFTTGIVGQSTNQLIANKWNRVYITCTANADATSPKMHHIFRTAPSAAGQTIKFYYRNPQFEQKDHPTPYTSSSRSGEPIVDSSGFGRNAVATNIITSSNAPINSNSVQFINANKVTINKIPTVMSKSTTEFSISFWFKANQLGTTHTIYTARTTIGYGIAIFGLQGNKIRFNDGTQENQVTFSNYTYDTNWHHYVLTRSSSAKKLYVDGVLKQTSTNVGTLEYIHTLGCIGASDSNSDGVGDGNFSTMNLSDFRIYMTELSAENILSLYQVKQKVDKNGRLFCNQYNENNFEPNLLNLARGLKQIHSGTYGANFSAFDLSHYYVDRIFTTSATKAVSDKTTAGFYVVNNTTSYSSIIGQSDGYYYYLSFDLKADKEYKISTVNNERLGGANHKGEYITTEWKHYSWLRPSGSNTYSATSIYIDTTATPFEVGDKFYIRDYTLLRISPEIVNQFTKNGVINSQNIVERIEQTSIFKSVIETNEINEI